MKTLGHDHTVFQLLGGEGRSMFVLLLAVPSVPRPLEGSQ